MLAFKIIEKLQLLVKFFWTPENPRKRLNMNFVESIKTCFVKYATFSGRASRSEFWYFCLFFVVVEICTDILDASLAGESIWQYTEYFGPSTSIFYVVAFLPGTAVSFRRLQDINRSGWWCFSFITIIGIFPLTYWYAARGTRGENNFGEDPLKNLSDEEASKSNSKWITYLLLPLLTSFLAIASLYVFLLQQGRILDDKVYMGQELRVSLKSKLIENQIINENDVVKFIYSSGIFSILADGQLMTDSRVISYIENTDGNVEVSSMLLENIKEIELVEEGGFLNNVYKIIGNDDADYEYVIIELPHDDENAESFINGLKEAAN